MKPCRSGFLVCVFCTALYVTEASLHGQQQTHLIPLGETQPFSANARRVVETLDFLGTPLDKPTTKALQVAAEARDANRIQELLDPQVLFVVTINPESRVKVQLGAAKAVLQQAGFTPVLV